MIGGRLSIFHLFNVFLPGEYYDLGHIQSQMVHFKVNLCTNLIFNNTIRNKCNTFFKLNLTE